MPWACNACRSAGSDHLRSGCVSQRPQLPEGLFRKRAESAVSWRVEAPHVSRHGEEEQYPQWVSTGRELPGRRGPAATAGVPGDKLASPLSAVQVRPVVSGRRAGRAAGMVALPALARSAASTAPGEESFFDFKCFGGGIPRGALKMPGVLFFFSGAWYECNQFNAFKSLKLGHAGHAHSCRVIFAS